TNTSAAPTNATLKILKDSSSYTGTCSFAFIGGGLTAAQVAALYQACRTLLSDDVVTDGATYADYGCLAPSSHYSSSTNKTWRFWQGWNGAHRTVRVRVFDHTTKTWAGPYTVAVEAATNDDHGAPGAFR